MHKHSSSQPSLIVSVLVSIILLLAVDAGPTVFAQANAAKTLSPSDTVREFYKAMREKRFREAFSITIFKNAVEGLSSEEYEDLRPDFEKIAINVPDNIEITGEQLSGDEATVFVRVSEPDATPQVEPVMLKRAGGGWVIITDPEAEKEIKKSGKNYFFNLRIQTHHEEVQEMLKRIMKAEFVYSSQHKGVYADMQTLINEGLLPKDVEGSETTGYVYHITLGKDGKTYLAGAEPARYGRTGRLSFSLDQTGAVKSADAGGKPLAPPAQKK
jgi:hypothetical protein